MNAIKVKSIPRGTSEGDLKEHFNDPENGGGRIEAIYFPAQATEAIIWFRSHDVSSTVLLLDQTVKGQPLRTEKLPPQICEKVKVTLGPEVSILISTGNHHQKYLESTCVKHYFKANGKCVLKGHWYQIEDIKKYFEKILEEQTRVEQEIFETKCSKNAEELHRQETRLDEGIDTNDSENVEDEYDEENESVYSEESVPVETRLVVDIDKEYGNVGVENVVFDEDLQQPDIRFDEHVDRVVSLENKDENTEELQRPELRFDEGAENEDISAGVEYKVKNESMFMKEVYVLETRVDKCVQGHCPNVRDEEYSDKDCRGDGDHKECVSLKVGVHLDKSENNADDIVKAERDSNLTNINEIIDFDDRFITDFPSQLTANDERYVQISDVKKITELGEIGRDVNVSNDDHVRNTQEDVSDLGKAQHIKNNIDFDKVDVNQDGECSSGDYLVDIMTKTSNGQALENSGKSLWNRKNDEQKEEKVDLIVDSIKTDKQDFSPDSKMHERNSEVETKGNVIDNMNAEQKTIDNPDFSLLHLDGEELKQNVDLIECKTERQEDRIVDKINLDSIKTDKEDFSLLDLELSELNSKCQVIDVDDSADNKIESAYNPVSYKFGFEKSNPNNEAPSLSDELGEPSSTELGAPSSSDRLAASEQSSNNIDLMPELEEIQYVPLYLSDAHDSNILQNDPLIQIDDHKSDVCNELESNRSNHSLAYEENYFGESDTLSCNEDKFKKFANLSVSPTSKVENIITNKKPYHQGQDNYNKSQTNGRYSNQTPSDYFMNNCSKISRHPVTGGILGKQTQVIQNMCKQLNFGDDDEDDDSDDTDADTEGDENEGASKEGKADGDGDTDWNFNLLDDDGDAASPEKDSASQPIVKGDRHMEETCLSKSCGELSLEPKGDDERNMKSSESVKSNGKGTRLQPNKDVPDMPIFTDDAEISVPKLFENPKKIQTVRSNSNSTCVSVDENEVVCEERLGFSKRRLHQDREKTQHAQKTECQKETNSSGKPTDISVDQLEERRQTEEEINIDEDRILAQILSRSEQEYWEVNQSKPFLSAGSAEDIRRPIIDREVTIDTSNASHVPRSDGEVIGAIANRRQPKEVGNDEDKVFEEILRRTEEEYWKTLIGQSSHEAGVGQSQDVKPCRNDDTAHKTSTVSHNNDELVGATAGSPERVVGIARPMIRAGGARDYQAPESRPFASTVRAVPTSRRAERIQNIEEILNTEIQIGTRPQPRIPEQKEVSKYVSVGNTNGAKLNYSFNIQDVKVVIKQNNIIHQQTDGIVNAVDSSFKGKSRTSQVVLDAAGASTKRELEQRMAMLGPLQPGEVISTAGGGGTLTSQVSFLLHILEQTAPNNPGATRTQNLSKCYCNCLKQANDVMWLSSITFPVLGCSSGFTLDESVEAFLDAVLMFVVSAKRTLHLKEIHLVDMDKDSVYYAILLITQLTESGIDDAMKMALQRFEAEHLCD